MAGDGRSRPSRWHRECRPERRRKSAAAPAGTLRASVGIACKPDLTPGARGSRPGRRRAWSSPSLSLVLYPGFRRHARPEHVQVLLEEQRHPCRIGLEFLEEFEGQLL